MSENALTELLRPYVTAIVQQSSRGDAEAQQIIDLYRLHMRAPHDPSAAALCREAFEGWRGKSKDTTP